MGNRSTPYYKYGTDYLILNALNTKEVKVLSSSLCLPSIQHSAVLLPKRLSSSYAIFWGLVCYSVLFLLKIVPSSCSNVLRSSCRHTAILLSNILQSYRQIYCRPTVRYSAIFHSNIHSSHSTMLQSCCVIFGHPPVRCASNRCWWRWPPATDVAGASSQKCSKWNRKWRRPSHDLKKICQQNHKLFEYLHTNCMLL